MIGQRQHSHRRPDAPAPTHYFSSANVIGLIFERGVRRVRSNTVGMPAGVKFSGWVGENPAGAGTRAAVRLLWPAEQKWNFLLCLPFLQA